MALEVGKQVADEAFQDLYRVIDGLNGNAVALGMGRILKVQRQIEKYLVVGVQVAAVAGKPAGFVVIKSAGFYLSDGVVVEAQLVGMEVGRHIEPVLGVFHVDFAGQQPLNAVVGQQKRRQ